MVEQTLPMQEIPKERLVKEEILYTAKSAGFWMRFWAFLLDLLVISAVTGILIKPLFKIMDWNLQASEWYAPFVILSAIMYFAYFVLMTKFFAQTLGKMAFGLRVVKKNGEELDWLTVIFRELVGRFISNTFMKIPYLIVIFTPKHQAVHDLISDTFVVHESIFEQTKEITTVDSVIVDSKSEELEATKDVKEESFSQNALQEKNETNSLNDIPTQHEMQDFEKKDEK